MIKYKRLSIPDAVLIEPQIFNDDRGFFFESFNQKEFEDAIGHTVNFVQDNHSKSKYGTLRGLHIQKFPDSQGKLVRVIFGEIFDVAVDLREGSKTYGDYIAEILSSDNKKQLWIPEGFAHGFLVLSDEAEVLYKATNFYSPKSEVSVKYDDPYINIKWPKIKIDYSLSDKDLNASFLNNS